MGAKSEAQSEPPEHKARRGDLRKLPLSPRGEPWALKLSRRLLASIGKVWRTYPKCSRAILLFAVYRVFVRLTKRFELQAVYAPKWMSHIVGLLVGLTGALLGVSRGSPDSFLTPIDQSRQYMLVWHPHGAFATIPVAFASYPAALGWFPFRYHALIADVLFDTPGVREMLMIMGAKRVNRRSVERLLEAGHNVAIQPGGIYEQLRTDPRQEKAYFPPNLGFIRQAIKVGSPLLPAYLFGENQIFNVSESGRAIAQWIHKHTGVPILPVTGRFSLPGLPKSTKIHIRVGRPVEVGEKSDNPTKQRVQEIFKRYVEALQELFDRYKDECLPPSIAARGLKIIVREKRRKSRSKSPKIELQTAGPIATAAL
ncbi:hypothetical protein AAMO2058_001685700 [Amorphochlora amoebiformis]